MLLISATSSQQDYSPMKGTAGNERNSGVREPAGEDRETPELPSAIRTAPTWKRDGLASNKQGKDPYWELQGGQLWFTQCKDDLPMISSLTQWDRLHWEQRKY